MDFGQKNTDTKTPSTDMDTVYNPRAKKISWAKDTKALKTELLETHTRVIVKTFCKDTSAHGWGKVNSSSNYILKTLWLLLTVSAYVFNTFHVTFLVKQYLGYPTEHVSQIQVS